MLKYLVVFISHKYPSEDGEVFQAKPRGAFDPSETLDPHVLVEFGMHG